MDYIKTVKNLIKAYEIILKKEKKIKSSKECGGLVGQIFGLRKGLDLSPNKEEIMKIIVGGRDVYLEQEDLFECGVIEGLMFFIRIMNGDEDANDMANLLIKYTI